MNNEDIKKILNDLYAVDPSLRGREKEVTTIIRAMAIKPTAHYDPAFAANLRAKILTELAQNGATHGRGSFASFFAGRSFRYAALGVAVIAVAAVSFAAFGPLSEKNNGAGSLALNSGGVNISNVGADAFGPLNTLGAGNGSATGASGESASAANEPTPTAAPTNAASPMMNAAASGSGGSGVASPGTAIMPVRPVPYPGIKYDYTGSPISQNQAQLDVLKKVAAPLSADQATAALEQAGFGQVDLSTFGGLGMSNVTLAQNESFGYEISLDLTDGTISVSENYNEWPQESATTTPLAASDIPSDSAVVAVANQFLSAHDVSTANYGTPTVTQGATNFVVPVAAPAVSAGASAGSGGAATAMPMIPYYPDAEQVLYPLVVNGMPVYNTNGNAIGLTVEVNVRYDRVESVYGLQTESYQSSAYDAITDASTILSIAENPNTYPVIYNTMNGFAAGAGSAAARGAAVITYNLGTPTMAYEDMYQTDSNGQSSEFLVPAYAFPVAGSAGDDASARNIMVPLIKDFEQQQQGVVIPPRPMPLTPAAQ